MEIEDMPDEILMMIFQRLPLHVISSSPPLVCRRWRDLIASRILLLRHKSQLDDLHRGLTTILATHRVPTLHSVSSLIANTAALAPRLRELTIHCQLPLDEMDFVILSTLGYLRHLDVFSKTCVLNERVVLAPSISSLVVNDNMAKRFLDSLCQRRKIHSLNMYGRSLHYPTKAMMRFISINSAHLTNLTLRCQDLNDASYRVLAECGALVALRLYSCWRLTARGAPELARPPRLRILHITGARMVRRAALAELLANLPPPIEELNLSAGWFGSEHAAALVARLPHLRHLELWRCRLPAADLPPLAAALARLRHLDTDLPLDADQLRRLREHPALHTLRCRPPPDERGPAGRSPEGRLRVLTAGAPVAAALRGDGDGPSADAFYSWGAPA